MSTRANDESLGDPSGAGRAEDGDRPAEAPIRMVMASATPALAAGIQSWLSRVRGWDVTSVAGSRAELRASLDAEIRLIVASTCLGGELVTSDVRELCPGVPLLILADGPDPGFEADLLRAGASGVIDIRIDRASLVQAVADLLAGRSIASLASVKILAQPAESCALTARQGEVLTMLAEGLSTEAIARRMFVSTSTVKTHIARAALRFGASGRMELAARAAKILEEHGQLASRQMGRAAVDRVSAG